MREAALQSNLTELEAVLGYEFASPSLLDLALTHRSHGQINNERLEFLGDSVLNFIVAEHLFERYADANEGNLSRFRARFVRQDSLAEIAQTLNLGRFLRLGVGEMKTGGAERSSILADAFEAVIGAVFRDGGFDCARTVALRFMSPRMDDFDPMESHKDPKTRLQEALQARRVGLPEYRLDEVTGPAHAQDFVISCIVERLGLSAVGKGNSRRIAEQDAAARVLEQFTS